MRIMGIDPGYAIVGVGLVDYDNVRFSLVELTAHYFATGQLKFDPGFIYKKIPMSQAQDAFQLFKTPGLVKGKILLSNEED